jgi:FKBP-type peptidyl-prolyl cis-trans isomerase FkpA
MRLLSFLAVVGLTAAALSACTQGAKGTKTDHGHTYINHTNKNGTKPQVGDKVVCHIDVHILDTLIQGTRRNGTNNPAQLTVPDPKDFPAGKPVSPLADALFVGTEGDSLTFFQTVDSTLQKALATLPKRFHDAKEIRYEIVFVDVITAADLKKKEEEQQAAFVGIQSKMTALAADYKAGKLNGKITTLPSGLKVLVEEKGSGAALKQGDQVETHYYGCLTDGKMFDNSFQRGEPLAFALGTGQMIKGFDEGTAQLNHGGKAVFFLPPALGYGNQESGPIPANSELIFYVEVQ